MFLSTIERLARAVGWLSVAALFVLSVLPGELRPHSTLPDYLEHFAAYLAAAGLLSVGYHRRLSAGAIALLLAAAAVGLEIVQAFVPGRSASMLDALASAGGALAGALLALLFLFVARRVFPPAQKQ